MALTSQSPGAAGFAGDTHANGGRRILKIAPTSFFADYGCHVRILEETRALMRSGQQVAICTYHTGRDLPGLDVRRAMNTPWQRTVQVGSNLHKLYYDALLTLKSAQAARQFRPDVIHAHLHEGALIGYPLSRVLGVPLLFDFQGSLTSEMVDHGFLSRRSLLYRPLRRLERVIDFMADRILTSSRNATDLLVQEFGYPERRIVTLTDSVDTEFFIPAGRFVPEVLEQRRRSLGIPEGRSIVVYLGLLAGYQGTGLLLEAAARLIAEGRPVHFLIMGFPGEDDYRRQAEQMGLAGHTTFTGRILYEEAPLHLALGDIAVSPKLSETEGNGKLLNYMAVGLPTVALNTPVANELLGPHGEYASSPDAEGLAAALARILDDGPLRAARGSQLRQRAAEQFSWDAAGQRLLMVYDEIAAERSPSRPR
ncbi:MAG: glycosyltransferase family 1 protein [Dehalococcoidia bacterium]|nr:glycosyltransferase family 1 protein [Dehalococcoidia bacterium]